MGTELNSQSTPIVWRNIFIFILYHLAALHGLYYLLTSQFYGQTFVWGFSVGMLGSQGVTCGAHRLWAHRCYKAKFPLRLFLCFCQTIAFQNDVITWARDHRVHHKFTDTNADPHNINRGFFFAHMGWLVVRKHPDVMTKGKTVDMSDLEADPILRFQRKYYVKLAFFFSWFVPTIVPWLFWGESLYVAFCLTLFRYMFSLHGTWLVNSAAHMYGTKPYDTAISPSENLLVSYLTNGEGWHNYHHTFPWDYKAAELDTYSGNLNTAFIDLMAKIGLAYDLRTASESLVKKQKQKTALGNGAVEEEEYKKSLIFEYTEPFMQNVEIKSV